MNSLKQFFLLSFCAAFCLAAQAQDVDAGLQSAWKTSAGWEFAPVGAKWCYFERQSWYVDEGYEVMECVKDTVISDLPMREIRRKFVEIFRDGAVPTVTERGSFYVHCKEDTVYIYDSELQDLKCLYIFNAQVGDTLTLDWARYDEDWALPCDTSYQIYIKDVTVNDVGGVPVKAYVYESPSGAGYGMCPMFYDYVGSPEMFFFPWFVFIPEYEHDLLSYYDPIVGRLQFCEKETSIYFPWDVYPWDIEDWLMGTDENYPWGVEEVEEQRGADVRVSYSAEEKRLTMELPAQGGGDGCRTALFTDGGAKVLEFEGESADFSGLPDGIYVVQVRSTQAGAVLYSGKIMVR